MNKILIVFGLQFVLLSILYAQSHIMVSPNKRPGVSTQKKQISKIVSSFEHNQSLTVTLDKFGKQQLIKVGPFDNEKLMAVVYLSIKKKFPHAVILNEVSVPAPEIKIVPQVKLVEKKVFITKEVPVEKDDKSLWIALFGLATIGVLYIFLSSDQIRRIKESQEKVKEKHKRLEEKQHNVLESMGENIHTIATVTQKQTTKLAQKVKETEFHQDISAVIQNESALLDITEDLIKFLQLKSKKIVVQNEIFNFNNVLNEVIGTLNEASKKHHVELILDIDKEVPYRISADSSHLGKILINLLDHYIQNSLDEYVRLVITMQTTLTGESSLVFEIIGDIEIEDKENFFETSYDEERKQYIGLGLFVAKELVDLMDGKLTLSTQNNMDILHITIPIEEPNKDRRMYRLTRKDTMKKRIMIADPSYYAAVALKKRFEYFRIETTLVEASNIKHVVTHMKNIDILVVYRALLTEEISNILIQKKKEQQLNIIALENLYEKYDQTLPSFVDAVITKPFSPSYIFETLEALYTEKSEQIALPAIEETTDSSNKLFVNKEPFKGRENTVLSDFGKFAGNKLLLVEDNLINQKVVLNVLSQSGIEILIANNGQEAVDMVDEYGVQIDFILMDINMPVLDGFNASRIIRENEAFNTIPIVSLTALVAEHEIEKMLQAGMNGYLAKPIKIDKLYSAFEMFMKMKKESDLAPLKKSVEKRTEDGLQSKDGLSYMKGNKLFYREVLKEFLDAYASSDILFETLLKEKKYEEIKVLFLDMRGFTGAIGAKTMFVLVSEIHQLLEQKSYKSLKEYVPKYREELTLLKEGIQNYLEQ